MSLHDDGGSRPDEDSWYQYRRLILAELKRINETVLDLGKRIDRFHGEEILQIKIDIAMLQVKAGMWGAVAGMVITVGAILIRLLAMK